MKKVGETVSDQLTLANMLQHGMKAAPLGAFKLSDKMALLSFPTRCLKSCLPSSNQTSKLMTDVLSAGVCKRYT